MPAVTVPPRPKGLPIATTHSPTRGPVGAKRDDAGSGAPASTFSRAMSVFGSVPTTLAGSVRPSSEQHLDAPASPTTWLLVTT